MNPIVDASLLDVAPDVELHPNAFLGYRTGRKIADLRFVLGPGAVVRAGTILYAGTRIGARLQTGHGVVIREECSIGDDFNVWNHTTIDYGCTIGNGVKIHCGCYVAQYTELEDGVFLAPGVVTANDPHPLCGRSLKGSGRCRAARRRRCGPGRSRR